MFLNKNNLQKFQTKTIFKRDASSDLFQIDMQIEDQKNPSQDCLQEIAFSNKADHCTTHINC